ncbi:MAG: hypothetical protein AAFV95_00760 [Bacteroidota bacterium]
MSKKNSEISFRHLQMPAICKTGMCRRQLDKKVDPLTVSLLDVYSSTLTEEIRTINEFVN